MKNSTQKTFRLALLLFLLACLQIGSAQDLQWVNGYIDNSTVSVATSTKVDASGNVYIAGGFFGTIDFDPGAGVTNLTSAGSFDIFISKLDASGNLLWAHRIGGSDNDGVGALELDASGNVYVTGWFQESNIDFNPGAGTNNLSSNGLTDVYVLKLSSAGTFQWVYQGGGTSAEEGHGLAVDGSGNVYVGGDTWGGDFDNTAGTTTLGGSGNSDAFLVQLNSSGTFQWGVDFGGTGRDEVTALELESSGDIFLGGIFSNTVDFDPSGASANQTSNGSLDAFLVQLNSSGNYQEVITWGGTSNDGLDDIAFLSSGEVAVASYFDGTIDINPFASVKNATSASSNTDELIQLLDFTTDAVVWSNTIDITSNGAFGLDVDDNDRTYLAGFYSLSGVIEIYNESGGVDFSNFPISFLKIIGAEVDGSNLYLHGSFSSNTNFDLCGGTNNVNGLSGDKAFIAEYAIESLADAPTLSATATSIFPSESTTISIQTGNLNSATDWQWYSGSCGGTPVGSGTSINVSPATTTTYYARGEGYSCIDNGGCAFVTITVEDPFLSYGLFHDLSNGAVYSGNSLDFSSQTTSPRGIAFSDDGLKMFLLDGNRNVYQYSLSVAFDLGSTITHDGSPFATGTNTPVDLEFNQDGTKMYVADRVTRLVNQFSLTTPFNITSGVSSDGTLDISTQVDFAFGMAFSTDGTKLFVSDATTDRIYQYSVATPFNLTAVVTYDNVSFNPVLSNPSYLTFNPEGTILYVRNIQYALDTPFDLSSGVTNLGAVTLSDVPHSLAAFAGTHFSQDGTKFYIASDFTDEAVFEYNLNTGGFDETEANAGSVEGTLKISVTGNTFTSAGAALTETTDYTITNLPVGLSPTLTVASDGRSAELTLSGTTSAHQDSNDITGLIFTFENSAFTNATTVLNSTATNSGFGIDFLENFPKIEYGYFFDPSNATPEGTPFDLSGEESFPGDIAFNPAGTKAYIIGSEGDDILQYNLPNPFDFTSGVTLDGSSASTTAQDDAPTGLTFNSDGTKVFIVGVTNDAIFQYTLTTPYDVTAGITYSGSSYDLSSLDGLPHDVKFNADGSKMFVLGVINDVLFQFNLTTPFEIGSGVTLDTQLSVADEDGGAFGMSFNDDGTLLAIAGSSGDEVNVYSLSTPYDITGMVIADRSPFSIAAQESTPTGIAFSAEGDKMFIVGSNGKEVNQYDLNLGGFTETADNFGDIEGSLDIRIFDDLFTNAGGTLTHGADYTISNLSADFTPNLAVAADGLSATLTLSGSTNAHQDINDVLFGFTFSNSAFVLGDASNVDNATSGNIGLGIDFTENNPVLSYGSANDLGNATATATFSIGSEESTAHGIAFNNSGTKMFVSGTSNDMVHQYTLTTPYDVSAGVTYDGSPFDLSGQDTSPRGLAFSSDGSRMFVVGHAGRDVNQYSLTTPFDITSGVSFVTNYAVAAQEFNPVGITFSNDGMKMYVVGFSGDDVNQYSLTTAFDISSGVSFELSFDVSNEEPSPYSVTFNSDGTQMFIVGITAPDEVNQYDLSIPFDVSSAVVNPFVFENVVADPRGIIMSPDNQRFFVVGGNGTVDVNQYDRNPGGYEETLADDGSVEGSLTVRLTEDMFTNAGGSLTHGTDYTINNLPAGLNPDLSISADAFSATLTLGGSATSNLNSDDVAALEFTFENSAFLLGDASNVANATTANSGYGIDFLEGPSIANQTFSIAENTANSTVVGTVVATDPEGASLDFSITAGNNLGGFALDSDGELTVADQAQLDFETNPSFNLTVEVTNGTLASSATITIDLTNVPEVPTDLLIDQNTIAENNAINDVIGTLSTVDVDAGETYTYTLVSGIGDDDNASFNIVGSSLRASEVFDFETKDSYSVLIRSDDGNGGAIEVQFTISVENVNENPTSIILSSSSFAENNAINDVLATISTVDEDNGETYTYSLVPNGSLPVPDNASFNINGDELRASEVFDFETKNSFQIRIRTQDGNGGSYIRSFTVLISNEFETPTDLFLDNTTIQENNTINDVVGMLSTTDEDAGETYTYTLVAGSGDTDNGSFNINGNELRASESFDFETKNSYTVRIQTDDGNGGLFAKAVAISITNQNESPTDIQLSSTNIDESAPIGTSVGTLSTTDGDNGETYTYTLVTGTGDADNASFSIVGNGLQSAEIFDFETKTSYSVRIQTNDGNGGTFQKAFTISINDQPPGLTGIGITNASMNENTPAMTAVGDLFALGDEITGVSFTFTLVSGTGDTGNSSFEIVGEQLRSTASFDFESQNQYSIRVNANDGSGATIDQVLLIDINDVNEAPTDIQLTASSINEGNAINDLIGNLSSIDEDGGDTHSYSLISGTGDTDNTSFNIVGNALRASEVFDFETKSSFSIRIQTSDAGGATFEEAFTISISDINDDPTALMLSANSIDENNAINAVIGNFSTTDQDASDVFTYSLVTGAGDTDNASFNISGNALRASQVFDFETANTFGIRVRTDDGNGGVLDEIFSISINDLNESPSDIMLSNTTIQESNPSGTLVGSLSSVDEDAAQTFTYSLVAGTGDTDNASFSITGGSLVSSEVFDFETRTSYSVRIQTDDGNGGTFQKAFTITITDLPASVTSFDLSNQLINENESVGTLVGTLSTAGEDLSGSFTYSLVAGIGDTDNASFSLSGDQLLTAESFDFEVQNSYSVRIMTDDGTGNTQEQSFAITVNDVVEAPTDILLSTNTIDENNATDAVIGAFTTTDQDAGETHSYSLVAGTGSEDNGAFNINGSGLRASQAFNFEAQASYSIRVETSDGNGGTFQKVFTVSVNDVAEAPTDVVLSANAIDENNSVDDVIGSFTTTDEDAGETFTYSLVAGTGDTNNSSFTIVGDELTASETFDFETQSSYSVRVATNDGNGGIFEKALSISISDQSEAPTDLTLSANSIDENAPLGTSIGTLNTIDEDNGETYTYTLVAGTGDTDNASFSIAGNELQNAEIFDFETRETYSVRIRTEDGNGGSFENAFNISITDVSEAPTDILLSANMIDENNTVNDVIGSFTTTDEDAGETHSYSMVSGTGDDDNAAFSIVVDELTAEVAFDFETQSSYSIRVESNDGNGGTFQKVFTISINDVFENTAPTVATSIADVTQTEGFGTVDIDLTNTFVDADGDMLTTTAVSDDEMVATVAIGGNTLTITEVGIGTTTITVTANDGQGGTVEETFSLSISAAANNAPTVATPISDVTQTEGFATLDIDLTNTFVDADGDMLTLTAVSSDELVVTTAIAGNTLTITEAGIGTSTITVTANDGNGGSVNDTFTFEVTETPNNAPTVANPLADASVEEGFGSSQISYVSVFEDVDGDALTVTVTSNDESVVTAEIIAGDLIQINEVGIGTSTITVTANDGNGGSINDTFTFEVTETPNNAPTVANPLADASVEEGFGSSQISYANVFEDVDGDALTVTVASSDETVVTAEIIAGDLIQINEVGIGTSTITVTANDGNGGSVSDTFTFEVTETANSAPTVANPLGDASAEEGFGSSQISYANVFEDVDGDVVNVTVASSDETVVTAEIVAGDLIQINEVGIGTSTITVTANDGKGGSISDIFIFEVTEAPNSAPTVSNPLADASAEEGFGSSQISYTNVFEDVDGDVLNVTVASSDESVVTAEIIAGDLIQINEVGIGTSTITVTADDGNGGSISDTFTFEVTEAPLGFEDEIEVSIYPNPVIDLLQVRSDESVSVSLTTVDGREIKKVQGSNLSIDMSSLGSAVYILTIDNGRVTTRKRIVKAN